MITENYFENLQVLYEKYNQKIPIQKIDRIVKEVLDDVKRMTGESDKTYNYRVYNVIYERLDNIIPHPKECGFYP